MKRRILLVVALLSIAGAVASSHPTKETCWDPYTNSNVLVPGSNAIAQGYLVRDGGNGFFYEYMESNAIEGLQRGGVTFVGGHPDPCQNSTDPDTLVAVIF